MVQLKKDWNEADFASSYKTIRRFLKSRVFDTNEENDAFRFVSNFKQIDNIIGTAYTSSGVTTAMWVCNVMLYLDAEHKYQITGFALGLSGYFYALCEKIDDENLFYVAI